MTRRVEIDPGDQPIPGLLVELHVVMALLQQLNEFAGVGVKLHRRKEMEVAFEASDADQSSQGDVTGFEDAAVLSDELLFGHAANDARLWIAAPEDIVHPLVGPKIHDRLAVMRPGAVVAAHAVFIKHGLDLALETEAAGRAVPGLDLARRAGRRD